MSGGAEHRGCIRFCVCTQRSHQIASIVAYLTTIVAYLTIIIAYLTTIIVYLTVVIAYLTIIVSYLTFFIVHRGDVFVFVFVS